VFNLNKYLAAQVSANACSQEKVVGDCRGSFVRYYFNKEANECQEFIYGGKIQN